MSWNHPIENQTPTHSAPRKMRGLVAGLLLAGVLGAALYFVFLGGGDFSSDVKTRGDRAIKEAKPVVAPKPRSEKIKTETPRSRKAEEVLAKLDEKPKPEIKVRTISPEEMDRLTNRVFKTGTEQLMSWVFSTQPGDLPMPIPSISDEDKRNIVAILISKNEIKETDSERIAFCKEQVDLAKKEMMKYLKEGGDPNDFLQYYFKELKHAFDMRQDAISQLQEISEEDPEVAEQVRQEINKKFEEDGIKPINKEFL